MLSCHRHNEEDRSGGIIERMLSEDITVAYTCDAGTPGISDPGEGLVARAWEAGIPVIPVSGPSAVATALSVCGFDTREFAFYGFLPRENKALKEKLRSIRETGISVAVLYESPHRVAELLEQIAGELEGARVCVCCDLTKKFERVDRGEAADICARLKNLPNLEKGEYCVVLDLSRCEKAQSAQTGLTELSPEMRLASRLLAGESLEEALNALKAEGVKRNELYRAKLEIRKLTDRLAEAEE